MSADDYTSGWDGEGDELVRRLGRLEWAPVPDELRERCWKDFEQRVTQQNGNAAGESARSRAAFNVGERYEMRRFAPARRLAAAELPGRGLASPGRSLVSSARLAAAQVGRAHTPRRALSLS
jgi:hypothetical protein